MLHSIHCFLFSLSVQFRVTSQECSIKTSYGNRLGLMCPEPQAKQLRVQVYCKLWHNLYNQCRLVALTSHSMLPKYLRRGIVSILWLVLLPLYHNIFLLCFLFLCCEFLSDTSEWHKYVHLSVFSTWFQGLDDERLWLNLNMLARSQSRFQPVCFPGYMLVRVGPPDQKR